MSTLIIYGSKYGFTKACVEALKQQLEDETVRAVNLRDEQVPDIEAFDKVIIGGSIYMGMLRKEVKSFCTDHKTILMNKKLGLFITCGTAGEIADNQLKNNYDIELYNHAIAKECLGGAINIDKAKFLDKMIIKIVSKADKGDAKKYDGIDQDHLNNFIQRMNVA